MAQLRSPFFSVVTITWNDRAGLRSTRDSVLGQTCQDFEWIVADGGSSDGTVDELQTCAHPSLSYVSEPDNGLYDAMNKGLARCTGDYIIFMNGGDRFASPTVLERVRQGILSSVRSESDSPDLIYGSAYEETPDRQLIFKKARAAEWINYGMFTHHQAMLYARRAVAQLRFDPSYKLAADYHFTSRIYRQRRSSLEIDCPICVFARGGLSEKKARLGRQENWRIQRDVLNHSLPRRMLTRSAYLLSAVARTRFRLLYDRLRFKQTAHAS